MYYLSALLGVSIFDSFGKMEWVYFGVGIAAIVALIVTVIVAIKQKETDKHPEDDSVTSTVETAEMPTSEPVAVATAEMPTSDTVAVATAEAVEVKPVPSAPSDKVTKAPNPIAQKIIQSVTAQLTKDHSDREVVTLGKVQIRFDKSQTAKLIQADDDVKSYYDVIKNELLSYKGVRCRLSWKHEAFYKGRVLVAKLKVRGKHLRLLLPLDPKDYVDTKYKVKDLSDKKSHADTPCGYAIKNDRRSVYAKDLIATVMQSNGVQKGDREFVKYSEEFPYDTMDNLIYRKLIKLIYSRAVEGLDGEDVRYEKVAGITADEVTKLLSDEEAVEGVQESARVSDKTKTGIVNVDVLSKTFEAGEKVTLDEIKKRVVGFNKKTTYVKVLARGVIDKPLIVEADDYSIDAVKMILLTGGKVIRTKKSNG